MRILSILAITLFIFNTSFAQIPSVSSGEIHRLEDFQSKYIGERTIDIWLPDGYTNDQKYSVLYMHDGQMLFDGNMTWNKQEWQVDEVAQKLIDEGEIEPCIVVGMHNGGEGRHTEYFPNKPFQQVLKQFKEEFKGKKFTDLPENVQFTFFANIQSDEHLKFIVEELKPYLDNNCNTYTDKEHTFVAGSSMGGLISMYAICEYPNVFGGAACISTHWPGLNDYEGNPFPLAFRDYLLKYLPEPSNGNKFYFDYGTETLDAKYEPYQLLVDEAMVKRGYTDKQWITRKFEGDDHSESSWSKRLFVPLLFLMGK